MLNLVKISIFSVIFSAGVFANDNEISLDNNAESQLVLDENGDYLFGALGDAIGSVFKGIKDLGSKAINKILDVVGLGSCSAVKKQFEAAGVADKTAQKDALDELIKSEQCTPPAAGDKLCDAEKKIKKDCY